MKVSLINIAQAGVISEAPRISELVLSILKFLLGIVGILAIIGIVLSGTMYVLSRGDRAATERAKKALFWSAVGLVAAMGSMIIVGALTNLI